jgi:ABC-type dipeptide/oligopeptide/nickel transport system permease component
MTSPFLRMVQRISLFLGFSMLIFYLIRLIPGDPATAFARASHLQETPEYIALLRELMGLNKSVFVQWIQWWYNVMGGDLGVSWVSQSPIAPQLLRAIGYTAIIGVQSIACAVILAVPIAIVGARLKNIGAIIDVGCRLVTSMPPMVFAYVLVMVFSVQLGWLPVQGSWSWVHSILPTMTLAFGVMAMMVMLLKNSLLECAQHESVLFARVQGISERVIWYRFILRRACAPFLTFSGIQLANVLCGSMIVEYWFSWPGFGRYFIEAVYHRDYPALQSCMMLMAIVFTAINGGVEWWRGGIEQGSNKTNVSG